ncbi:MAG: hypothetical protein Q8941_13190 [Bacteroidota bacterium]|nr:hypothetical protein [Bacteroidota bacterium]
MPESATGKPNHQTSFLFREAGLIGDGEMDPACRPLYVAMIHHYMPNSQCFLFINRSHGVGGKDFFELTQQFIDHPYQKTGSNNKNVIAY